MTARDPIDLTEESILNFSSITVQGGATVFVAIDAVVFTPFKWEAPSFIDHRDWRTFSTKCSNASANIVFLSKFPTYTKRQLFDLGLEQPLFVVDDKTTLVKTLAEFAPTVFIDTNPEEVQNLRKICPSVKCYWTMPEKKISIWSVISEFIDLF